MAQVMTAEMILMELESMPVVERDRLFATQTLKNFKRS